MEVQRNTDGDTSSTSVSVRSSTDVRPDNIHFVIAYENKVSF